MQEKMEMPEKKQKARKTYGKEELKRHEGQVKSKKRVSLEKAELKKRERGRERERGRTTKSKNKEREALKNLTAAQMEQFIRKHTQGSPGAATPEPSVHPSGFCLSCGLTADAIQIPLLPLTS